MASRLLDDRQPSASVTTLPELLLPQAEEEFEALRSSAEAEAHELHRQLDEVRRDADAAAATAAEEAEQLRLEARQAAADHKAQVHTLSVHWIPFKALFVTDHTNDVSAVIYRR
jgi:hypothetical protein